MRRPYRDFFCDFIQSNSHAESVAGVNNYLFFLNKTIVKITKTIVVSKYTKIFVSGSGKKNNTIIPTTKEIIQRFFIYFTNKQFIYIFGLYLDSRNI